MAVKVNVLNSDEGKGNKDNQDKLVFAVFSDNEGKFYAHDGKIPDNMNPEEFRLKLSEMLATCIGTNIAAVENSTNDEKGAKIWATQLHDFIDLVKEHVLEQEDTKEESEEEEEEKDPEKYDKRDFWDDLLDVIAEYSAVINEPSSEEEGDSVYSTRTPVSVSVIFGDTNGEIAYNIMLTRVDPDSENFDGVTIKTINRRTGPIDSITIRFADLCDVEFEGFFSGETMRTVVVPYEEYECEEDCEECELNDEEDDVCLAEQSYNERCSKEYTKLLCAITEVLFNMDTMYNCIIEECEDD